MLIELAGRWVDPGMQEVVEEFPNPNECAPGYEVPYYDTHGFVLFSLVDGRQALVNARYVRELTANGHGSTIVTASGREVRVSERATAAARALNQARQHAE